MSLSNIVALHTKTDEELVDLLIGLTESYTILDRLRADSFVSGKTIKSVFLCKETVRAALISRLGSTNDNSAD